MRRASLVFILLFAFTFRIQADPAPREHLPSPAPRYPAPILPTHGDPDTLKRVRIFNNLWPSTSCLESRPPLGNYQGYCIRSEGAVNAGSNYQWGENFASLTFDPKFKKDLLSDERDEDPEVDNKSLSMTLETDQTYYMHSRNLYAITRRDRDDQCWGKTTTRDYNANTDNWWTSKQDITIRTAKNQKGRVYLLIKMQTVNAYHNNNGRSVNVGPTICRLWKTGPIRR
jgi:hypothetical protein